jgi:hypothetical protein
MPQGHNTVGGVWEDAQMVSPSLSPTIVIHQGEVTNPSFVAIVVDHVRNSRPIVRNNVGHVHKVVMLGLGDVLVDDRNQSTH